MVEERPAIGSMQAAIAAPAPDDERTTVSAIAVVPKSQRPEILDEVPITGAQLVDQRVDALLNETFLLLKERTELRSIADQRSARCTVLLEEARKAKRLVRAFVARGGDAHVGGDPLTTPEYDELAAWAAEVL